MKIHHAAYWPGQAAPAARDGDHPGPRGGTPATPLRRRARHHDRHATPFILSSHRRIAITSQGWFDGIGRLDAERGELHIGINALGEGGLAWFLDAQGLFYALTWQGRQPRSLGQWLGLSRQHERYAIAAARPITAGELLHLTEGYSELSEDASRSADLRSGLNTMPPGTVLGAAFMAGYFGTGAPGQA